MSRYLLFQYLTKQATALRDMNESRLKIYEQLELSMVDLERNNLRMTEEGILDKERIKTLSSTVQTLELKCEELQRCLDDVILRRTGSDRDGERSTLEGSLKREDPLLARRDYTCQVYPRLVLTTILAATCSTYFCNVAEYFKCCLLQNWDLQARKIPNWIQKEDLKLTFIYIYLF